MEGESRGFNLETLVRRIVSSVSSVQHNDNVSSSPAANVEEEINQRFQIPRGPRSVSQPQSSTSTAGTALAAHFNPSSNYGFTSSRTRRCRQQRNLPYQSRQRTSSRRSWEKRSSTGVTLKEVILLPRPSHSKIPKFNSKLKLQECELISDGCGIDRAWSDAEVREFLSTLFKDKLIDREGVPVRSVDFSRFCLQVLNAFPF